MKGCFLPKELWQLQPLIIADGAVYIKTVGAQREKSDVMVTPFGVQHFLRRLCSVGQLEDYVRRANKSTFRSLLDRQLQEQMPSNALDSVEYFVFHLAPAFSREYAHEESTGESPPERHIQSENHEEAAKIVDGCPMPEQLSPSLWVLGRIWLLSEGLGGSGRFCVRLGGKILMTTGEFAMAGSLCKEWMAKVERFVADSLKLLVEKYRPCGERRVLERANAVFSQTGSIEHGDLLLLAGDPVRLGHVIPPHFNTALGRKSERDLAIAAPLWRSSNAGAMVIYQRGSDGVWRSASLPHGLCLGGTPPEFRSHSGAGLKLIASLRWAAIRIAGNGRFHASDQ